MGDAREIFSKLLMMRGDGGVDIYRRRRPLVFLLGKFATESSDSLARRALTRILTVRIPMSSAARSAGWPLLECHDDLWSSRLRNNTCSIAPFRRNADRSDLLLVQSVQAHTLTDCTTPRGLLLTSRR